MTYLGKAVLRRGAPNLRAITRGFVWAPVSQKVIYLENCFFQVFAQTAPIYMQIPKIFEYVPPPIVVHVATTLLSPYFT